MNSSAESCFNGFSRNKTLMIVRITAHAILAVAAIFGSFLVIRAFQKFENLRRASNIILVSLSVADCLLAISFILDITHMFLKLSSSMKQGQQALCKSSASLTFLLVSVIILHLALISMERFIAVKFALRYNIIVTNRRAAIASMAMWLWTALIMVVLPQTLKANSRSDFERFRQAIHPCLSTREASPDRNLSLQTKVYLIFVVISLLIIPLLIILYSYTYIFIVSHKHRRLIARQGDFPGMATIRHELKGALTLAFVVSVCLLSIIPLLVATLLRFFGELPDCRHLRPKHLNFIAYVVATGLNAICNPLIYGWRNGRFRSAFRTLLGCDQRPG